MQRLDRLDRFVTSSYYDPQRWPDRMLGVSPRLHRTLSKRHLVGLDGAKVGRRPSLEWPEIWHRNLRRNRGAAEKAMFRRDLRFDDWVSRRVVPVRCRQDDSSPTWFWGFQGSCRQSLAAAQQQGAKAICEFATAHVTAAVRILNEEAEKHPDWAGTISNFHFPSWYREHLEAEPHAADVCIAASDFTRRSLLEVGIQKERIEILPLAADLEQFAFERRAVGGKLKVLFVGGVGQRKGFRYLIDAIQRLDSAQVQLSVLGPLPPDTRPLDAVSAHFQYLGQTDQSGVAAEMLRHDVMVLPSVFEGFGLVIVEAMATGMPVIASTHSCGPEVIREGMDGFVIEPNDVEGMAGHLHTLASNRDRCVEMGVSASQRARDFGWEGHQSRLSKVLESIEDGRVRSSE